MANEIERPRDIGTDSHAFVTRWLREIDLASRHERKWRERAEKIVKRYRDEDRPVEDNNPQKRFNILYANTEVLKGVMYQKTPSPDVRRRFLDRDPVGRQTAQILQRALSYSLDAYDFDGAMRSVVEDALLPGRGLATVKYVPTMAKVPVPQPDGTTVEEERKVYEEVTCEYKEWKWVRISPAPSWAKVRWVAFGELMTRDELEEAFGKNGRVCTLDWKPEDKDYENDELFKRALVWAIWDKKSRSVIFVSKGLTERPLNVVQDPLGLDGFFPCPKPVYSICTNGNLIPVPEFTQYQDQAAELDEVTARIDHLIDGLKRRGFYDSTCAALEKLGQLGDNEFIPVGDAAKFIENGGIKNAIFEEDITVAAQVLQGLYQQRDQIKQVIYEVTGIADIVRGSTKANETLGAQELKARYANVRVGPRQKAIEYFARDLLRLKAELISEKFDATTLKLMTGEEMWQIEQEVMDPMSGQPVKQKVDATEQIMQILRNDKLRGFRVDVETDSTVQPDASEEQKNRIDLLGGIANFITGIGPAVQAGYIPMDFAKECLSFGARGFKLSPQLEDAIDRLGQQAPPQQQGGQFQNRIGEAQAQEAEANAQAAQTKAQGTVVDLQSKQIKQQQMMQQPMMPQ